MMDEMNNNSNFEGKTCSHEGSGLEEFQKEYDLFKEKYELPEFFKLNELFEIEDMENCETEFLLRKIRKIMADKLSSYVRFIEIILNPANAPMFFFKLIKKLDEDDKKVLSDMYEDFGKLEISVVVLDLDYHEEKEAQFIKKIFDKFNGARFNILKVVEKMSNGEGVGIEDRSRSYFG